MIVRLTDRLFLYIIFTEAPLTQGDKDMILNTEIVGPIEAVRFEKTDWIVILPTVEYPLELSAVFIGGIYVQPISLWEAGPRFGKLGAIREFKRQGNRPLKELPASWAKMAHLFDVKIYVIEEMHGGDDDSFCFRPRYVVTPHGLCGFYTTPRTITWLQLLVG